MNVALWVVAGVLAVAFLMAGSMKALRAKADLVGSMAWVEDFSQTQVKLIGTAEILAAIGLVVPPLVDIAPWLTPLAALGLVLLMAGAAVTHIRRKELQMLPINSVLLLLAAFVAWGRFGPHPF